ncbi:hypothetical protein ABZP36_024154 [Zizania latifolia]
MAHRALEEVDAGEVGGGDGGREGVVDEGEHRAERITICGPVTDPSKLPKWDYDGASTSQAPGEDSEVILYPKAIFKQPDLVCLVASGANSVVLTVPHSKLIDPKHGRTEVFDGFSTVFSPDSSQGTRLLESNFIKNTSMVFGLCLRTLLEHQKNKKKPLEKHFKNSTRHLHHLPTGARAGFFIGDGTGVGKGRTIAGLI